MHKKPENVVFVNFQTNERQKNGLYCLLMYIWASYLPKIRAFFYNMTDL